MSGCSDAGPRMFCCRSLDVMMQVRGCYDAGPNFRDGNTVGESRSTFGENQCSRLNVGNNTVSQKFSLMSGPSLEILPKKFFKTTRIVQEYFKEYLRHNFKKNSQLL